MPHMDEPGLVTPQSVRDGFVGQRMVVVARPAVRAAATRPVTRRLLVTDAGFFPHAARHGRSRASGAPQHVLLVCTDGEGWCRTPEGRFLVQRGDAVILPPGVPHEYAASAEDAWTLWWLHFVGDDANELAEAARSAAGGPVTHLRDAAPIASLVSQAIDGLDAGTAGGLVRASGCTWSALTQVIATGRRTPGPTLSPVEQAIEHLRSTAPRRTSVKALASMVGLSVSQFSELFREHVGVPPLRYQSDLRMARARELLDSTTMPVAAVAEACGYGDPLYFSRHFTQAHGQSPSVYRARTS